MMVTGLQLPFKSSPLDGMLMKPEAQDSEAIQSLSFGEILKAKEKKLKQGQEMNSALAAVALAALQTRSVTIPLFDLSVKEEFYKADIQPALRKGLPLQSSSQPSSVQVLSQTDENQEKKLTGIQKDERWVKTSSISVQPAEKPETAIAGETVEAQNPSIKSAVSQSDSLPILNAEYPAGEINDQTNVSDVSDTLLVETPQAVAKILTNPETIFLASDTDPDRIIKATTFTGKPDANAEVVPAKAFHRVAPPTLPAPAKNPLEAKTSSTESAESRVNPRTSAAEDYQFAASVITPKGPEILRTDVETNQEKGVAETKTKGAKTLASNHDVPQSSASSIPLTDTPVLEESATLPSLPAEAPVDTRGSSAVRKVSAQPVTRAEKVSAPSAEYEPERTASQAARSQARILTEANMTEHQTGSLVSPILDNVSKETAAFDRNASLPLETISSPSSDTEPDVLDVSPQTQSSSKFVSVRSEVSRATVTPKAKMDINTAHPTDGIQQLINQTSEANDFPVVEATTTEKSSTGKVFSSTPDEFVADMRKVGKQNTPPAQETNTRSSEPVNRFVTSQVGLNEKEVNIETKTNAQSGGVAVADNVQVRDVVTMHAETAVSNKKAIDVYAENEANDLHAQATFDSEIPVALSMQTSLESFPVQDERNVDQQRAVFVPVEEQSASHLAKASTTFVDATYIDADTAAGNTSPIDDTNFKSTTLHQTLKFEVNEENTQSPINATSNHPREVSTQNLEMDVNQIDEEDVRDPNRAAAKPTSAGPQELAQLGTVHLNTAQQDLGFVTKMADKPASLARPAMENSTPTANTLESTDNPSTDFEIRTGLKNNNQIHAEMTAISSVPSEKNGLADRNLGNITPETNKAVSFVGNAHTNVELPVVAETSFETEIKLGSEGPKPLTTVQADEVLIPLEQPELDSAATRNEVTQEKFASEADVVILQLRTNGTSTAGLISTDQEALHQLSGQVAVLQSTINYQYDQVADSPKNISFDKEIAAPQTSMQTIEAQQLRPETMFVTEADTNSRDSEGSSQPVTPTKNPWTTVVQSDTDVQQHQNGETQKTVSFEREAIKSESLELVSELRGSDTEATTRSEIEVVENSTELLHQSAGQPKGSQPPTILPFETESRDVWSSVSQQRTSLENKGIDPQISANDSVMDSTRADSMTPIIAFSYPDTDAPAEETIPQPVVQKASSVTIKTELPKSPSSRDEMAFEKPALDPQSLENQVDSSELPVETSDPLSDHPVVSSSTVIDVKIVNDRPQDAARAATPAPVDLDVPEDTSLQAEMDQETPIVNAKYVERPFVVDDMTVSISKPDFDVPVTEASYHPDNDIEPEFAKAQIEAQPTAFRAGIDQRGSIGAANVESQVDANTIRVSLSSTDLDVPVVEPSSHISAGNELETVTTQTEAQPSFTSSATNEESVNVKLKAAEKPVDADEFVAETAQPNSDIPVSKMSSQRVITSEPKSINPKPVVGSTPFARPDSPEVKSFQLDVRMEKQAVDPPEIEQKLAVEGLGEASQHISDVTSEEFDHVESQPAKVTTVTQARSFTDAGLSSPGAAPFQAVVELDKPVMDPEGVEEQVNSSTTVSQMMGKSVGKIESRTTTGANVELNDQSVISVEAQPELDNHQTTSVRGSRTSTGEASLPVSSIDNQETPVSVQSSPFRKVDSGEQDLKADHISSTEEKALPVEKQYEPNEKPESTSVAMHPIKEPVAIGSVEKGPTVQMTPNAVEVVQQVIRQLNGRLKSGPTSMHLQLNPESLGAIDVEVVRDVQGVSVTFFAEQSSTGKLLETQLSQLRQSLVDSGVQLSGLNIGQHGHSRQEEGFGHQNMGFAQQSPREPIQSTVNTPEGSHAKRVTGQTSEINYLI